MGITIVYQKGVDKIGILGCNSHYVYSTVIPAWMQESVRP